MAEHDSGAHNGDATVGESNRPFRDADSGIREQISAFRDLKCA